MEEQNASSPSTTTPQSKQEINKERLGITIIIVLLLLIFFLGVYDFFKLHRVSQIYPASEADMFTDVKQTITFQYPKGSVAINGNIDSGKQIPFGYMTIDYRRQGDPNQWTIFIEAQPTDSTSWNEFKRKAQAEMDAQYFSNIQDSILSGLPAFSYTLKFQNTQNSRSWITETFHNGVGYDVGVTVEDINSATALNESKKGYEMLLHSFKFLQ